MRLASATINHPLVAVAALAVGLAASYPAKGTADVPQDAKARAALYQTEARKVLTGYHWVVARDQPGEFVAVHAAYPAGASFGDVAFYGPQTRPSAPSTVFYLTVTFKPVSLTDTRCIARLVTYYMYKDSATGKQRLLGPAAADSPEMTHYVQNLISQAAKRLKREHPEYCAP